MELRRRTSKTGFWYDVGRTLRNTHQQTYRAFKYPGSTWTASSLVISGLDANRVHLEISRLDADRAQPGNFRARGGTRPAWNFPGGTWTVSSLELSGLDADRVQPGNFRARRKPRPARNFPDSRRTAPSLDISWLGTDRVQPGSCRPRCGARPAWTCAASA